MLQGQDQTVQGQAAFRKDVKPWLVAGAASWGVFILAVLLSSSSQLLRVTVLSRSRGQSRHVCFNKVFSPPPPAVVTTCLDDGSDPTSVVL